MKISTKGRYALRLMLDLATNDKYGYTPVKEISLRQDISDKYLEQIISRLSKAGLVISARGAQGGYKLAKAPEACTVGEILRVLEGDLAPVACAAAGQTGRPGVHLSPAPPLRTLWAAVWGAAVHLGAKTRPFPLRHPATPAGPPGTKRPPVWGRLPGYRRRTGVRPPGARGRTRSMKDHAAAGKW